MRNKQYLTAIRPLDGALVMSTMRFADEVVPRADIEGLPHRTKPEAKQLRMAEQLIEALSADWDPSGYHDTYAEELRRRIKAKDAGKKLVAEDEEPADEGKVLDLMKALEASLDGAKGKKPARKSAAKKPVARSAGKAPAKRAPRRKSA
jgi:DNA end-binding protein Ku